MSSLTKSQAPRVHWHPEHGWLVDTVFPMTARQLQVCIDYTRKVQKERISSMRPGDIKDTAIKALNLLSVSTIKQNLQQKSPWERDKIAFEGTADYQPKRIISLGAQHG